MKREDCMEFRDDGKTDGKKRMPDRTQYRKGEEARIKEVVAVYWNEFITHHRICEYRNGQYPD